MDEFWVKPQIVELRREQPYLVVAQLTQSVWRELLLVEERKHRGRPVMTGGIVRRPGEARRPRAVMHQSFRRRLGQLGELAEPPRHDRAQRAVGGQAQKPVAAAQLAVLVAASDHVGGLEALLAERERDDVERVIGIDEQLRAGAL